MPLVCLIRFVSIRFKSCAPPTVYLIGLLFMVRDLLIGGRLPPTPTPYAPTPKPTRNCSWQLPWTKRASSVFGLPWKRLVKMIYRQSKFQNQYWLFHLSSDQDYETSNGWIQRAQCTWVWLFVIEMKFEDQISLLFSSAWQRCAT